MERFPSMSRALAEQQVNECLSECSFDLRGEGTTNERGQWPSEADLKPPVEAKFILVVTWVGILAVVGMNMVVRCCNLPTKEGTHLWPTESAARQAEVMLDVPADSLNTLFPRL